MNTSQSSATFPVLHRGLLHAIIFSLPLENLQWRCDDLCILLSVFQGLDFGNGRPIGILAMEVT